MFNPNGPAPGTPGAWDPASGDLPPGAVNQLVSAGIDPTDIAAVRAHYEDDSNGAGWRPYFYAAWLAANGLTPE